MEITKEKMIFIEKFKDITRGYSNQQTADKLGKSLDTINKWRSDTCSTMPDTKGILEICNQFGCDPNMLFLEDAEAFNKRYGEITDITGLSSKSIRVLQQLQKRSEDDNEAIAWKNTAIINEILEGLYNSDSCKSFLTMVYDYTHPDDISSPDNKHEKYSAWMAELIRGSLMDNIQSWLHLHVKKKPKEELASFTSPEEFDKWYKSTHKKTATKADQ